MVKYLIILLICYGFLFCNTQPHGHPNHGHQNQQNNHPAFRQYGISLSLDSIYFIPNLAGALRANSIPLSLARVHIVVNSICGSFTIDDSLNQHGHLFTNTRIINCQSRSNGGNQLDVTIDLTIKLYGNYIYVSEHDITIGTGAGHAANLLNNMGAEVHVSTLNIQLQETLKSVGDYSIPIICHFRDDNTVIINGRNQLNQGNRNAMVYSLLTNAMIYTNSLTPERNLNWGVLPVIINPASQQTYVLRYNANMNLMVLGQSYSWVPGAILHELGHHVMFRLYSMRQNPLVPISNTLIHRPCSDLDESTAWLEGYASGYASIIGASLGYVHDGTLHLQPWSVINQPGTPLTELYNFEVERYGCDSTNIQRDEGRIAAMMYDLSDIGFDSITDPGLISFMNSKRQEFPTINANWFGNGQYTDNNGNSPVPVRVTLIDSIIHSTTTSLQNYIATLMSIQVPNVPPFDLGLAEESIRYNYGT